jgi:hypothetical protein
MKALAIVIVLGLVASAYAKDATTTQPNLRGTATKAVAPTNAQTFNAAQAVDFFAVDGVVWARAADGRTFQWRTGNWAQGDVSQVITAYKPIIPQPKARTPSNSARRYSFDPSAVISYPGGWDENSVGANDPPIAGGRGRFSD